jgi:hypothetical protein
MLDIDVGKPRSADDRRRHRAGPAEHHVIERIVVETATREAAGRSDEAELLEPHVADRAARIEDLDIGLNVLAEGDMADGICDLRGKGRAPFLNRQHRSIAVAGEGDVAAVDGQRLRRAGGRSVEPVAPARQIDLVAAGDVGGVAWSAYAATAGVL